MLEIKENHYYTVNVDHCGSLVKMIVKIVNKDDEKRIIQFEDIVKNISTASYDDIDSYLGGSIEFLFDNTKHVSSYGLYSGNFVFTDCVEVNKPAITTESKVFNKVDLSFLPDDIINFLQRKANDNGRGDCDPVNALIRIIRGVMRT